MADISAIKLPDGITYNIKDTHNVWYGTCSTGEETFTKIVTTSTGDFSLTNGNVLFVKFDYDGTKPLLSSDFKLKVDGLDAKGIITTRILKQWYTNQTICFIYNGTSFQLVGEPLASTSVFGLMAPNDKTKLNGIEAGAEVNDVTDVTIDNTSIVSSGVAKLVTFAGGSSSSSSNKAGIVPKPPTISESGQWHLLSDGGWIEAYPQTDSAIPWASKYTTVNSKPLSSNITLTASDVGAVPTTRTINSKALSSDITLTASDVGAVPTSRTVNSKALSSNITLSASDVGALASDGTAVAANFLVSTDDRSNNRAPSYYMGKGKGTYNEFKTNSTIGTNTFMSTTFCSLTTYILWNDSSGGRPVQIAVDNNGVICHRWATSDSAWSSWIRIDNTIQQATPTKSGSTWTAGNIVVFRRGTTCYLKINGATFSQITARTTVATVPTAFLPYTETSGRLDGTSTQIFITAAGELRIDAIAAGQRWGGIIYLAAN